MNFEIMLRKMVRGHSLKAEVILKSQGYTLKVDVMP